MNLGRVIFAIICISLVGWAIAVWWLSGTMSNDLYEVTR